MKNPPVSVVVTALLIIAHCSFCGAYPSSGGRYGISGRKVGPRDGVKLEAAPARADGKDTGKDVPRRHLSPVGCRSNSTHISWPSAHFDGQGTDTCTYQTFDGAVRDCVEYLRRNVMPFDIPNLETLGFPSETDEHIKIEVVKGMSSNMKQTSQMQRIIAVSEKPGLVSLPDGLSDGIVNQTLHLALQTKISYPWTDMLPQNIFYEYVLNFACSNEARTNWRPLLTDAVKPIVDAMITSGTSIEDIRIEDVVKQINQRVWTSLGKTKPGSNETVPIHFVGGNTPLIFDPMSVLAFGYASCTGLAIMFAFSLRAAGIPARMAGTPAWSGDPDKGNHNWVEVWTPSDGDDDNRNSLDCGGRWRFLEPSCGDFGNNADSIEKDPCKRWFCNKDRFDEKTRVYATRYDRTASDGTVYPLAWDEKNADVPGSDRTDWYNEVCRSC